MLRQQTHFNCTSLPIRVLNMIGYLLQAISSWVSWVTLSNRWFFTNFPDVTELLVSGGATFSDVIYRTGYSVPFGWTQELGAGGWPKGLLISLCSAVYLHVMDGSKHHGCFELAIELWAQQRCSERNKKFSCEVTVRCRLLHKYVAVNSWRVVSLQFTTKGSTVCPVTPYSLSQHRLESRGGFMAPWRCR